MAEPKKETVRIALPPRPEQAAGSAPSITKRDTARIVLPTRAPVAPISRLPPKITPLPAADATTGAPTILPRRPPVITPGGTSPLLQPLPKPAGVEKDAESARSPAISPSVHRGPKQ